MDLLPTLCETAGVDVDHAIEGRSILPTLMGESQGDEDRVLYWLRREGTPRFRGLCQHAVRAGDHKLLHNDPFSPLELYHLDADPLEADDRAASDPEQFARLAGLLQQETQRAGGVPWQGPDAWS
jgi:arylsulfatase A-like enzyme